MNSAMCCLRAYSMISATMITPIVKSDALHTPARTVPISKYSVCMYTATAAESAMYRTATA
jgi:hypothetical protein